MVSDEQGNYRFSLLPPGTYTVRFALQGFGTVVREGVTLTPGFTSNLNITLGVASVAETVTVVGDSPIVDTTNAVVATNFSEEAHQRTPDGTRRVLLLAITPGVQSRAGRGR